MRDSDIVGVGGQSLGVERAFLGCLVQLPHRKAAVQVEGLAESDFTDWRLAQIFDEARRLVACGVDPAPQAIYARVVSEGRWKTEHHLTAVTQLLHSLFRDAPAPPMVWYFRRQLLERTLRRRVALAGERTKQVAESSSTRSMLAMLENEYRAIRAAAARVTGAER